MKKKTVLIILLIFTLSGCGRSFVSEEEVKNYLNENYDFLPGEIISLKYLYTDCSDSDNQFIKYCAEFNENESRILTIKIRMKKHLNNYGPDFSILGCEIEKVRHYYDSTFICNNRAIGSDFVISILENGSFSYCEDYPKGSIKTGYYDLDENRLILYENQGNRYVFLIADDILVFQKAGSDSFSYYDIDDQTVFFKKDGALTGE